MGKKYTYSYQITAKNAMGKYYTEMQHIFVHPVPDIERQSTQGSSMTSQKILKELMPSDNFSTKVNINILRSFFLETVIYILRLRARTAWVWSQLAAKSLSQRTGHQLRSSGSHQKPNLSSRLVSSRKAWHLEPSSSQLGRSHPNLRPGLPTITVSRPPPP